MFDILPYIICYVFMTTFCMPAAAILNSLFVGNKLYYWSLDPLDADSDFGLYFFLCLTGIIWFIPYLVACLVIGSIRLSNYMYNYINGNS